jgi:hypothetical protein
MPGRHRRPGIEDEPGPSNMRKALGSAERPGRDLVRRYEGQEGSPNIGSLPQRPLSP